MEIILFAYNDPLAVPIDFIECLRDEPQAYIHFHTFLEAEQMRYVDCIYGSKNEATRLERMARAINKIMLGEKPK